MANPKISSQGASDTRDGPGAALKVRVFVWISRPPNISALFIDGATTFTERVTIH